MTVRELVSVLPETANVLITGASSAALGRIHGTLLRFAVDERDGAIVVSTEESADNLLHRLEGVCEPSPGAECAFVDATPKDARRAEPNRNVWQSRSPVDFNGSALALQRCYRALSDCETVHLLFDTLTTPLLSADSATVLRYAHHVMLEGGSKNGLQLFPVSTNVTTDRDVTHLKHLVDGVIQVRTRRGERQIRLFGWPDTPDQWVSFQEIDRENGSAGLV